MTDASKARAIETAKKHNEGQEKLRLDLQTQATQVDQLDRWPSWLVSSEQQTALKAAQIREGVFKRLEAERRADLKEVRTFLVKWVVHPVGWALVLVCVAFLVTVGIG